MCTLQGKSTFADGSKQFTSGGCHWLFPSMPRKGRASPPLQSLEQQLAEKDIAIGGLREQLAESDENLRLVERHVKVRTPFPRRWGCSHLRLLSLRTCSV